MNIFKVSVILMLFLPANASAGWLDKLFGYSSYEDCILGELEGKSGDYAAKLVRKACMDKFPDKFKNNATPRKSDSKNQQKLVKVGQLDVLDSWWDSSGISKTFIMKVKNTTQKELAEVRMRMDALPKSSSKKCKYENSIHVKTWGAKIAQNKAFQISTWELKNLVPDGYKICYWIEGYR